MADAINEQLEDAAIGQYMDQITSLDANGDQLALLKEGNLTAENLLGAGDDEEHSLPKVKTTNELVSDKAATTKSLPSRMEDRKKTVTRPGLKATLGVKHPDTTTILKPVSKGSRPSSSSIGTVKEKVQGSVTTSTSARRQTSVPSNAKSPLASSSSKTLLSSSNAKSPLSHSTSKAPALHSTTTPTANATKTSSSGVANRPSVISPVGSAGSIKSSIVLDRPRAFLSEGLATKKPPAGSRPSPATTTSTSTKPANLHSAKATVKANDGRVEGLEAQLNDSKATLQDKNNRIAALELQLLNLQTNLDKSLADLADSRDLLERQLVSKESEHNEAQQSKQEFEKRLAELSNALEASKTAAVKDAAEVARLTTEVEVTGNKVLKYETQESLLREQLFQLEGTLASTKLELESCKHSYDGTAQLEREQWTKTVAELEAELLESKAAQTKQATLLEDFHSQKSAWEEVMKETTVLRNQMAILQKEKEAELAKVSELQVEVLELREDHEKNEATYETTLNSLLKLQAELDASQKAQQELLSDAATKEIESKLRLEQIEISHASALQLVSASRDSLVKELHQARDALEQLEKAHSQANRTLEESERTYSLSMQESERLHATKVAELTKLLETTKESHAKTIKAIRDDHDAALQQAFQNAKNEAGLDHGRELQALRAKSEAAIAQLQASNAVALEEAKASFQVDAEERLKKMEKSLAIKTLELKATQDDLAKAKSAFASLTPEVESLTVELEKARHASSAALEHTSSEHAEEMKKFMKELEMARDDLAGVEAAFAATKESFEAISQNHSQELEEAVKARIEEMAALRQAHDERLKVLSHNLSASQARITELEIELASAPANTLTLPNNGAANGSPIVSKEELSHMHDAHNMKIHEMEAEHKRAIQDLQQSLEVAVKRNEELEANTARKDMEMHFLESEGEDNADRIKRLEDELEALKKTMSQMQAT